MGEIFIRFIELPYSIKGVTTIDSDGNYNVYINSLLSYDEQLKTEKHELIHIRKEHFYNYDPVVHNEREANLG